MQRCLCSCALVALMACAWVTPALAQDKPASTVNPPNTSPSQVLPGTAALQLQGDITSQLVDGVDRFLLKQLEQAPQAREKLWPGLAHANATQPHPWASELSTIIGLRDARIANPRIRLQRDALMTSAYVTSATWQADQACWPVYAGIEATGLYVRPTSGSILFQAVVIPDAGQTPEQTLGVGDGHETVMNWAAQLAAIGGEVIVTTPISRHREARRGRAIMTDQEFLYRSAFELGRHIIGYQVSEVLSAVDALNAHTGKADPATGDSANGHSSNHLPMLVFGWGEGGLTALHAAAVSASIDVVCISGHFQAREHLWQEPIHRNVQSLLTKFGDAELAAMVAPRHVIIDAVPGPQVDIAGDGGAPGKLSGPSVEAASAEWNRTQKILSPAKLQQHVQLVIPDQMPPRAGASASAVQAALTAARVAARINIDNPTADIRLNASLVTAQTRRLQMLEKWDRFNQYRLEHAVDERTEYWKSLKTDTLENFKATVEPFREKFAKEVIGQWDIPLLPPHPRTRLIYDKPKWLGYEVVLDVFPDVIAYGVLLLPRNQPPGEKRPCVVFQHGLEGRPKDCIEGDHPAYHDVAAQLAEQGFVVFAPQNLYIFHDRFRTLQRKSNPLGKTLFSTIIPQHQQICRWLAAQPQVDPKSIAFYGLSYGGKSAMRIPPLVPEYCLSICSADFNDWVWKNASSHANYSYVWTMEYEIFEFDLGSRFNYAEMATLIAPRPFMVERGHFDGVAPDDRVAAEFAKVRHLYSAKLGLSDDARLEWFVGPHTIHGQGTFQFLREKLSFQP